MALPKISICGNINKKELRYTQGGMAICSFQIECSEKNSKGEWENLYIKSAVFEKSAEFVNQYFNDGDVCIASGKLVTEVYENKDGKKIYEIKLKFPEIQFAPKAKGDAPPRDKYVAPKVQVMPKQSAQGIDVDDSEIPF